MAVHWLDDIIELVRREGKRFAGSSPDKGAHHETAADLLARVRDGNASHEETRDFLSRPADDASPVVMKAAPPSGPPPFAG